MSEDRQIVATMNRGRYERHEACVFIQGVELEAPSALTSLLV